MNPEIQELKQRIEVLEQQLRQFLNQGELDPQIVRTIRIAADAASVQSTGNTSGLHQTVNEAGSDSYSVADSYNGSIVISDTDGNLYKLGYYTV